MSIPQELVDAAKRERAPLGAEGYRAIDFGVEMTSGEGQLKVFRQEVLPAFAGRAPLDESRFLDAGCGPGYHVVMLAASGARWTCGLDPAWEESPPTALPHRHAYANIGKVIDLENLIAEEDERLRFDPARIAFVQGDVAGLPLGDGVFDGVFSLNSLEHFPDVGKALREMLRVLKPGGVLLVSGTQLFHSRRGSHMYELLPAPWGHLFVDTEERIRLYRELYGHDDTIFAGQSFTDDMLRDAAGRWLNRIRPSRIRRELRGLNCRMLRYEQEWSEEDVRDARRWCVLERARELEPELTLEDLAVHRIAAVLQKAPPRWGDGLACATPFWLKRLLPRGVKNLVRRLVYSPTK